MIDKQQADTVTLYAEIQLDNQTENQLVSEFYFRHSASVNAGQSKLFMGKNVKSTYNNCSIALAEMHMYVYMSLCLYVIRSKK